MSLYTASSIPLDPIPNVHSGTGSHVDRIWVVDPSSVPGSGTLQFVAADVQVTTFLFQLERAAVPDWFGVAVPGGAGDFTQLHIFFHPLPAQAGYLDSQYAAKAGLWKNLFYYMERLGYQADAARRNQIIVMPFLTQAAQDTGIFKDNWLDICTQILTSVRASMGADDGSALQIQNVVVSSFSVGVVYSNSFRHLGTDLGSYMREVWDFDGNYSTSRSLSQGLHSTAQYTAIKYDQVFSSDTQSYHVPLPRWKDYAAPPTNGDQVHGLIRDYMFLHASSISSVGEALQAAGTSAGTATSGVSVGTPSAGGGAPAGTSVVAPVGVIDGTAVSTSLAGEALGTTAGSASAGSSVVSPPVAVGTGTGMPATSPDLPDGTVGIPIRTVDGTAPSDISHSHRAAAEACAPGSEDDCAAAASLVAVSAAVATSAIVSIHGIVSAQNSERTSG